MTKALLELLNLEIGFCMFTIQSPQDGRDGEKKICIERRNKRQREMERNKKEITGEQKLRDLTERSGEGEWRNNENRGNEMGWGFRNRLQGFRRRWDRIKPQNLT